MWTCGFPRSLLLVALLGGPTILGISGCGGDADDGGNPITADGAARDVMTVQGSLGLLVREQLELCVGAVAEATRLKGANRPVLTGTLDLRDGTGSYSDTPADALLLRAPDFDQRFVVERMQVTDIGAPADALFDDHDLSFTTSRGEALSLSVSATLEDNAGLRTAEGTMESGGRTLDVSFSEDSVSVAEVDGNVSTYEFNGTRAGAATGDGVDIEWRESERYLLFVSSEGFENRTTEVELVAEVDGFDFAMDDGVVKRSFRNGAPAEPEFWAETTGSLTKAGDAFGSLSFDRGTAGEFEVRLTTPEGVEVLETYAP